MVHVQLYSLSLSLHQIRAPYLDHLETATKRVSVGAHQGSQHLEDALSQLLVPYVAHARQRQEMVTHIADSAGGKFKITGVRK